ncbi:shikimate kinase [Anseongella ginsenosidimutans]|uniref:shikimate kinase n=1 Tax=Anseongella ginsenosidimutans TaxID=496056 RepID=UPI00104EC50B|nr:shikimate kinase [Anseongella ginsenosidimutans]QEC50918.1 shikimate kinase [Anseongella ginsenosidimutans]
MKLFLIGYMGAGKTTLGKPLAQQLALPFIDMDTVLEEREGKTITNLFEELGESGFREKERDILRNGIFPDAFVMATGGGAPCFFDNMDWMNHKGVTMYLRAHPKEIARRLEHEREQRPLLRSIKKEDLEEVIGQRLAVREKFYLQAQLVMENNELTVEQLLEALQSYR